MMKTHWSSCVRSDTCSNSAQNSALPTICSGFSMPKKRRMLTGRSRISGLGLLILRLEISVPGQVGQEELPLPEENENEET